ncbi:MAG: hypothetical protein II820_07195 [Ruminiclostridium sp.]|nr:hypothetical protein [Ruminiclostridium sp.]
MMRYVDRLADRSPEAAEFMRGRLAVFFSTSLVSQISVCLMSGIAAGLFSGGEDAFLRYASLVVMCIVWAQASVLAGFCRQWFFILFSGLYLIFPYVLVLLPGTAEAAQATEIQKMLSDLCTSVILRPIRLIAGDGETHMISFAVFAAFTVLFFIGSRIRAKAKRSDFYCRTRLGEIDL